MQKPATLEIGRDSLAFPVAVAGRFGAGGAALFGRFDGGGLRGAALGGFGQGALGGGGQRLGGGGGIMIYSLPLMGME